MSQITGRRSHRRTKVYLVEAVLADYDIVFDVLAHGPEHAIRRIAGVSDDNVLSVRRMRNASLLRAILMPDDENFDLHRGEIEEGFGL
jgi:hypothetical protein